MPSLAAAGRGVMLLLATAVLCSVMGSTLHAQDSHRLYLPMVARPDPFQRGQNLLPNYSFEGGWYHPNGVPELQIPNNWHVAWQTGPTGFGSEPWDVWVRPEVRVLPSEQLPPEEHPLFIWHGNQTVKIFKGFGAISFELATDLWLPAGKYVFEMSVFPDLVVGYDENGNKIWAPDPLSGEVKLLAGSTTTGWLLPTFGQKNSYYYVFTLSQAQTVRLGAAMRGRYAIRNNGWFMDDWWLWRQDNLPLPPGVYPGIEAPRRMTDEVNLLLEPFVFSDGMDHE